MCLQDTSFVGTMDPRELYATEQLDERLKLAHVLAPCTLSLRQPRQQRPDGSPSPQKSMYFCMYHWDHLANPLRPVGL